MDGGDADPATLFSFLAQLHKSGGAGRGTLPYLTPEHGGDIAGFARRFFRDFFRGLPSQAVLVFDDCQDAAGPAFHVCLREAALQAPEGLTIFALSREPLPTEFARLQANRTAGHIDWEDLRLTSVETAEIVKRARQSHDLSADELQQWCDGWAAGLILLLANPHGISRTGPSLKLDAGASVFSYIAGEVFDRADEPERELLRCTALFPQFTPEMAAQLSGNRAAPQILDQLHRRQYFTERHVSPQATYRYHDLFREFLLARAGRDYEQRALNELRAHAARLLLKHGQVEPAVDLFLLAGEWEALGHTVEQRAADLIRQGLRQKVLAWICALPPSIAAKQPWILFWHGVAESVTALATSRSVLQRAADAFALRGEPAGEVLSVAAYVDGYFEEWNTIGTMDPWLDRLLRLLDKNDDVLSSEHRAKAYTSLLIGLLYRRPAHPRLADCADIVATALASECEPEDRLRMTISLAHYLDLMGRLANSAQLLQRTAKLRGVRELPPRLRLWQVFRHAQHHGTFGDDEAAISEQRVALRMVEEEGVMISPAFSHLGCAHALLGACRWREALDHLDLAHPLLQNSRWMEVVYYYWLRLWALVVSGDTTSAHALWNEFATMPLVGVPINAAYNNAAVYLLTERGDADEALCRVADWRGMLRGMRSPVLDSNLDLMEAYVHLRLGDREAARECLRRGFGLMASVGIYGNCSWIPQMMGIVCAEALSAKIEAEFVAKLILGKKLEPPRDTEVWPWPVKVYALGRFLVLTNDEPLHFARRPQYRPLELLKAIVAAGPNGVRTDALVAKLWEDSDGDAAARACTVAIHRLRKLLGDEASIRIDAGIIRIDPGVCWVDAFAFDRGATDALSALDNGATTTAAAQSVARLYSGRFLGGEIESPWAVTYRDRLHAKFQRLVVKLGRVYEDNGSRVAATDLYRHALEVDNLQEEVYRRLMICLRGQGEIAEAMNVYRRCRNLLSIVLGVAPSAETEAVARTLHTSPV